MKCVYCSVIEQYIKRCTTMVKSLVFFDSFPFNSKANDNAIHQVRSNLFNEHRYKKEDLIHSKDDAKVKGSEFLWDQ